MSSPHSATRHDGEPFLALADSDRPVDARSVHNPIATTNGVTAKYLERRGFPSLRRVLRVVRFFFSDRRSANTSPSNTGRASIVSKLNAPC